MRKQYIHFKEGLDEKDVFYMHPHLFAIYAFINLFCYQHGIKFVTTSMFRTPEHDSKIGAISKTHQEDRAFDFSIREDHGWNYIKVQRLLDDIQSEKRLFNYGAKVWADKEKTKLIRRPIVIHKVKGGAMHAHVQVSP